MRCKMSDDKNKDAYIMVRVSPGFKKQVQDHCKNNCINLSELIRNFLANKIIGDTFKHVINKGKDNG